jgi:undecaprenyl-diphosphatase
VIQSGAVLAVLPLFSDRLRQFAFQWRERATQLFGAKILVAFVITGIGGVLMDKAAFKLPERLEPVAWALLVGGVAFVLVEMGLRGRALKGEVTWNMAIIVGLAQLVAAGFPGTSRSGATILAALVMGLNRVAATEFTFLVGIPTMLAAGGLKIFKSLAHHGSAAPEDWAMVMLGFIASAAVSFVVVKWLLRYVQTHTFSVFGWYRIGLAALIFGLLYL